MRNYLTFLGKEVTENLRTKKLLVLVCVFGTFAILSPVLARYIGELFNMLLPADEVEMFNAIFGDPHYSQAYAQFYSNMLQIGTLAVILLFMGTILREKKSGTADLMLTKGLTPATFVAAKFTVAACFTLITTVAAVLITYLYTYVLFGEAGSPANVLLSGLMFYAYLLMTIGTVIFFSSIARGMGTSAVFSMLFFFVTLIVSSLPRFGPYTPGAMLNWPTLIAGGRFPPTEQLAGMFGIGGLILLLSLIAASRHRP
jgi:ABC-2 type transport system permease protein